MADVLAITLAALQADATRLQQVASHLANAQTAGFRREVSGSFAHQLEAARAGDPAAAWVRLDPRSGSLRATGSPLDLALAGEGWFEVLLPDGPAWTRRGDLRLDAQGRLVTAGGHPVQGSGGDIRLTQAQPRIDAQGHVHDGTAPGAPAVAQLRIAQFAPGTPAQRLPGGLLRFAGEPLAAGEAAVQVRQGWLENANVDPAAEMVRLLQAVRHAESLQKLATGYDDMLGGAIRRLGEP